MLRRFRRVKLTPAFVKGHPQHYGYAVEKVVYHIVQLPPELPPAFLALPCKAGIPVILYVYSGEKRRGYGQRIVLAAAVYHILPYEHPQPVAVIIPPERLYLYMLPEHIEAHILHGLYIGNHSFIRGCGIQPVRPVALIQHAVVKVRLVVQEKPLYAVFVLPKLYLAHTEVALDHILAHLHAEAVKVRVFRRPRGKALHTHAEGPVGFALGHHQPHACRAGPLNV